MQGNIHTKYGLKDDTVAAFWDPEIPNDHVEVSVLLGPSHHHSIHAKVSAGHHCNPAGHNCAKGLWAQGEPALQRLSSDTCLGDGRGKPDNWIVTPIPK